MRSKIKTKILIRITSIVILSLVLISMFSYFYFGAILEKQAIKDNRIQMQQTMQQVDYILKDIQQYSYNMIVDTDIEEFAQIKDFVDTQDKVMSCEKIISKLRKYISLRDYIQSIILNTQNGVYSTDAPFDSYYKTLFEEDWYKAYKMKGNSFAFSAPHIIKGNIVDNYKVISFIIHFKSIKAGNDLDSELIINVYYEHLENILKSVSNYFNECILADNGSIIYLPENNKDSQNNMNELLLLLKDADAGKKDMIETNDGYFSVMRSGVNNWEFAVFISKKLIFDKLRNVFVFDFLYIIVVFIMVVVALTPVISNIIRPISKLSLAAKEISKGNLDANLNIKTGDEIELLGTVFNNMTVKLKEYIHESIENEKIKHKMEQDLLISQINPHFIYNTLNTAIYLARKNRNDDIEKVIGSLIKVLQNSLKISKREIFDTIEQEVDLVDQYVLIQKYRYRDSFKVEWEIEEGLRKSVIPKSIIQPLVENALFHGILPEDREDGIITIKIHSIPGYIIIKVSDNGIGMNEEMLNTLNSIDSTEASKKAFYTEGKHIGIANIKERVRNLYGEDSFVRIEGKSGVGTYVTIKVKRIDN